MAAQLPVSASAIPIAAEGMKAMTADGKIADYETPRALETEEVKGVVEAFRQGAKNALAAGFDGVEIHGANGYLLEQFLQSRSNQRTDQYGGSIENRARLLLEVTQAAIDVWGAGRVGVRLSPYGIANGSGEPDPMPLYTHVVKALDKLGLAYLHFIEPRSSGSGRAEVNWQNVPSAMVLFRPLYSGVLMTAGRLYRRDRERGDRRRPRRHHRLRPHLHLQPRPAAAHPARATRSRRTIVRRFMAARRRVYGLSRACELRRGVGPLRHSGGTRSEIRDSASTVRIRFAHPGYGHCLPGRHHELRHAVQRSIRISPRRQSVLLRCARQ